MLLLLSLLLCPLFPDPLALVHGRHDTTDVADGVGVRPPVTSASILLVVRLGMGVGSVLLLLLLLLLVMGDH